MSLGGNSNPTNGRLALRRAGGASGECEWRLPSGEDLISFALAVGLAAGPLAEPIVGAGPRECRTAALTPCADHRRRS